MTKLMLMDAKHPQETRVVIADDGRVDDFDFVTSSKAQIKGNIYLAKITRVEPSLQAAFVEYGGNKQGFLPFSEIHPDYYQIPVEDRQRLLEEEQAEAEREEEAEEAEIENQEKKRSSRGGRGRGRRRGRGRDRNREENAEETEQDGVAADAVASEESSENTEDTNEEAVEVQPLAAEPIEVASQPVEQEDDEDAPAAEPVSETAEEQAQEDSAPQAEQEASEEDEAEAEEDKTAESVSGDDEQERKPRRGSAFKRYRIQEVIKRNQIVLVQVIKEERGNKGCSLTTYLSLAGRYCVLMPNSPKGGGVSRKIGQGDQRRMLKEILSEMREKRGFPAIIRTAGIDRTKAEIKRDYEYLVKVWTQIREDTLASNAPSLIYEESDIIKRSIRDMYTGDIEQVLVQGADAYRDCKAFMKLIMPSHAPRVKEYKEDAPVFASHGVEAQLASMHEPEVRLPSGGSIVIQATEALVSIDVNSGRSTTERNVEETAIKTNLEAAREVARQMRLRDLAGLVVIDFIDMYYGKNRRTLERAMKDCLKSDRAKVQVGRISTFGLMELSRQRLRPSIAESSTRICPHCQGTGFVMSVETLAIQIIRLLEREAAIGDWRQLKVTSTPDVVLHLLNEKRHLIQELEQQCDVSLLITIDSDIQNGHFKLFKTGDDDREVLHQEFDDERGRKRKSRGRRGGRNRRRREEAAEENAEEDTIEEAAQEESSIEAEAQPQAAEEGEAADKPKRGRRRRSATRKAKQEAAEQAGDEESVEAAQQPEEAPMQHAEDAPAVDEKPKRTRRRRASTRRAKEQAPAAADADSPVEAPAEPAPQMQAEEAEKAAPSEAAVSEAPKRKGWWNRVVQSEQSDA